MQQVKHASNTSSGDSTVTKVMSAESTLTWVSPAENEIFEITQEATLPTMVFEFRSQHAGSYKWSWAIEWEAKASGLREKARAGNILQVYKESGSFVSSNKIWIAEFSEKVLGGKLIVSVVVGQKTLVRTVFIKGKNPDQESVANYVATLEDMTGFEELLEQETNSKHFINLDGEPIAAFDEGYGITQMTNPAPSYEQAWNWKANILAGSTLYREKVCAALNYLGQAGRTFTDDQLRHEVFSRWNGGSYHEWDTVNRSWARKKNIVCDSKAGNIGGSMDNENNKNKTEAELRERDKNTYKNGTDGQSKNHPWVYRGVCYADHVLAE